MSGPPRCPSFCLYRGAVTAVVIWQTVACLDDAFGCSIRAHCTAATPQLYRPNWLAVGGLDGGYRLPGRLLTAFLVCLPPFQGLIANHTRDIITHKDVEVQLSKEVASLKEQLIDAKGKEQSGLSVEITRQRCSLLGEEIAE